MREAVRRIYRERKALTASLKVYCFLICSWFSDSTVWLSGYWLRRLETRCCDARRRHPDLHLHLSAYLQP